MAMPVRIKSKIRNKRSKMIVDGDKEVDISLVPDAKIGDWLLCHADLAVQKLDEKGAQDILELVGKCEHNHLEKKR